MISNVPFSALLCSLKCCFPVLMLLRVLKLGCLVVSREILCFLKHLTEFVLFCIDFFCVCFVVLYFIFSLLALFYIMAFICLDHVFFSRSHRIDLCFHPVWKWTCRSVKLSSDKVIYHSYFHYCHRVCNWCMAVLCSLFKSVLTHINCTTKSKWSTTG